MTLWPKLLRRPKVNPGQDEAAVKLAVNIREAAAMLAISPRSIQNYIRLNGSLPGRSGDGR
jgi:hypothetical protein